jgi:hypothetical protein
MSDGRRFLPVEGDPDNCHRSYYGAQLVDWLHHLADRWLALKSLIRSRVRAGAAAKVFGKRWLFPFLLLVSPVATTNAPAEEMCSGTTVNVAAASAKEHRLSCSAAAEGLRLLSRCGIALQRPLQIEVVKELRHPIGGPISALFDAKQERILLTRYNDIHQLVLGTPYQGLPRPEYYKSLIVHEVVHAVMHQNLRYRPTSHAAHEYAAYTLQIESLSPPLREQFLRSANATAAPGDFLLNDFILFSAPALFAARAYKHFKASPDGCAHLNALLRGEVAFIWTPPGAR